MSKLDFVLALDTGTNRIAAAKAQSESTGEFEATSITVAGERDSVAAVAFVTEDGDLLFGEEAERRGQINPERVVREFTRSIGDDVPIVAGGFAMQAEDVLARMVLWIAAMVSGHEGVRPSAIALTHPTEWHGHRIGLVRSALSAQGFDELILISSAEAAARQYLSDHPSDQTRLLGVYDLGGGTCSCTVLRAQQTDLLTLGTPVVIEDVGGAKVDDALLRHVLTMSSVDGDVLLQHPDGRRAIVEMRSAVTRSKEALSFDGDVTVPVRTPDHASSVRMTRSELEAMIGSDLDRTMDALEQTMDAAQVVPAQLDAIILVGGASQMPLVAQRLSERFDRPLSTSAAPQAATALGAAGAAWVLLQQQHPAHAEEPAITEPAESRAPRRRGLFAAIRPLDTRHARQVGSAALLTAAVTLVAGGIVLGTTPPAGDRSNAADDALSDSSAALMGEGATGTVTVSRPASDYSVFRSPTPEAEEVSEPSSDTEAPRRALAPSRQRVADSSTRATSNSSSPRTPQSPAEPSAPAGPAPDPGGPSPSPSDPTPTPSDPPPPDPGPTPTDPTDPPPADPDPAPTDPPPTDPEPTPTDPPPADPEPTPTEDAVPDPPSDSATDPPAP